MRRPEFDDAVRWIANNDEPDELNPDVIRHQISVVMIADVCNHDVDDLVRQIIDLRDGDDPTESGFGG